MVVSHPDTTHRLERAVVPSGQRSPLRQFALWALIGFGLLFAIQNTVLAGVAGTAALIGAGVYAFGAGTALLGMRKAYPHGTAGLCNAVTLFRLVLVSALVMALAGGAGGPWGVSAIATLAFALDGADGWLARRERLVSAFGARFDVEVDSAFALVLAIHAYVAGDVGVLVLLLGLPRYLFAAAGLGLPWLKTDLPERLSRKAVCVVQLAVLIALQLPFLGAPVSDILVAGALLALGWSFGRDIRWLWRNRA